MYLQHSGYVILLDANAIALLQWRIPVLSSYFKKGKILDANLPRSS